MLQKFLIPLLLGLVILATSWSLLHPQLFKVHDYVHAARVAEMARGIADGQIPVRWSANFGYGYGMPLFQFYAPLPYFIGALLWLINVPMELVVKLLFFIPSLLTVIIAYYLGKLWFSRLGAVVVAAAITLAPYRAVNLFVRGAVAESWGMAFFVVSLLGLALVVRRSRHGWLVLLSGLVGMMLSHNLTTMMAIPALIIWGCMLLLLEVSKVQSISLTLWSTFLSVSKCVVPKIFGYGLLAIGITAFYWLPALAEKQFTQMDSIILTGYFDYHLHFLYARQFFIPFWGYGGSNWGPEDGISFFLGYGQIIGSLATAVVSIGLLWKLFTKRLKLNQTFSYYVLTFGSFLIIAFSLFLSLQRSLVFWDALSVLSIIQFPWRFLAIASTLFGFFAAIWLLHIPKKYASICAAILLAILLTNARYFQPSEYLTHSEDLYYTDAVKIQSDMSGILPDFITLEASNKLPPTTLINCPEVADCQSNETLVNRSHENLVRVKLAAATDVVLATAAFPGWKVQVDGDDVATSLSPTGLLQVSVPAGEHVIGWYLSYTRIRMIADLVSFVSLCVLIYLIIAKYEQVLFVRMYD